MPTYSNDDWSRNPKREAITYNGMTWGAGEQKPVSFFVPEEKGLRKVSDEPKVAEICLYPDVLSVTAAATRVYVPDCAEYCVSMICKSGNVQIRRNYADANATTLDEGDMFKASYRRSLVEAFYLSALGGGASVSINIERLA